MTDKKLIEKIEQVVSREVVEGRFDGSFELREADIEPCFEAKIQDLRKIFISFNPGYEKEKDHPIERITRDITRHEINHEHYQGFKGCPRNLDFHVERISEPISEVLMPKNYGLDDVHYIANCLEDTILHTDLNKTFSLDGITDFFEDVGEHAKKYTPFYEAHVKLNLYFWGSKKQKKVLKQFFTQNKKESKVTEVLQRFLQRTGINALTDNSIKDRRRIREFLNNEDNWREISKIYAEEFSQLMEPSYALPIFNHSGKGTQGREAPAKKGTGKETELPLPVPNEGNLFDKQMYDPQYKQARIKRAYNSGESIPAWLSHFEAQDLLYQSLAQKLKLKVETFTQQASWPIFHYGRREFNPEKDNLKHITFGFDEKGEIKLQKRRYHEDMPLEYKVNPKGFPQIRFCLLDTSKSMAHAPDCDYSCGETCQGKTNIIPWGDKSKYHYALLGWYGLLEYLKQNHILSQTGISLGNLSDKTILAEGLIPAKQLALTPQFGNTQLDLEAVKKMFDNQGMLIFTLSDGEIQNWENIKKEFIEYAKQHYYFHLQIGSENTFTKELKKAGLLVEYVHGAEDLANKVIDIMDGLYRR